MNWNHHTHEGDPAADAAAGADAAAAAAAAAAGQGGEGGQASLLAQGQGTDWLPEKFRVLKDGTQDLDVEASARKLATSYGELEKTRGGTLPKTADEYKVEGLKEGIDFEEVRKDPMFQSVLKDAHAAGISNEAVNFFLGKYFNEIAPQLLESSAQLSVDEARTELAKIWKDDGAVKTGLASAMRAVRGFGAEGDAPGSFDRLMQRYGNDPDFLAFASKIGAEMSEDKPIAGDPVATQDWESQVNAIKADPAYSDAQHPQHKEKVAALTALYNRRYGANQRQLGGSATR